MPTDPEETDGIRHHSAKDCDGHPCPFHGPSDHSMREFPMKLRTSGLIERICPHGVGHPDPDSAAFFARHGHDYMGIHGCDGCCDLDRVTAELQTVLDDVLEILLSVDEESALEGYLALRRQLFALIAKHRQPKEGA